MRIVSAVFYGSSSGSTTLQASATASGTLTLPAATDTLVGKATTDTLTNKTFDTAGTGNVFKVNGTTISAKTGTGSVVLATSPTIATPAFTGTVTNTGQIQSSLATGTAPLSVTSTTPATNLHANAVVYDHAASDAQMVGAKVVAGFTQMSGGTATVTLTGSAVFSNGNYYVVGTNQSNSTVVKISVSSATQFTITSGAGTDFVHWIAVGK
jgi:hypothetical protein